MGGGASGAEPSGHPPQELPWPVPERVGPAVPARDDREQGGPGAGGEVLGVDGAVGAGAERVPGEAAELVWDVSAGERRDAAVEELGDSRRTSHFGDREVDFVGH